MVVLQSSPFSSPRLFPDPAQGSRTEGVATERLVSPSEAMFDSVSLITILFASLYSNV